MTCSAASRFPSIITPEESLTVIDPCRHDRELYLRCEDRERDVLLEEIDGLGLETVRNIKGFHDQLDPFIPIADDFAFKNTVAIGGEFIGLQLKDVYEKRTGRIRTDILEYALFHRKKVILFPSGRDDLIEDIWPKREELDLFTALAQMGLVAITGMNFSVYECMCPFGQHYNIKKSLKFSSLVEAAGVPSIPHFYAVNENQRRRVVAWLNLNPQVQLITINCQSQKSRHDLEVLKTTIRYILENTNHPIHIILEGFRISRLEGLYEYLPYLHIAQKQPFMDALYYKERSFVAAKEALSVKQTKTPKEERGKLVSKSIQARREFISCLRKKYQHVARIPRAWLVVQGAMPRQKHLPE